MSLSRSEVEKVCDFRLAIADFLGETFPFLTASLLEEFGGVFSAGVGVEGAADSEAETDVEDFRFLYCFKHKIAFSPYVDFFIYKLLAR